MITHRICIFVRSRDASDDYPQNKFLWTAETLLMITNKIIYIFFFLFFYFLFFFFFFVEI